MFTEIFVIQLLSTSTDPLICKNLKTDLGGGVSGDILWVSIQN